MLEKEKKKEEKKRKKLSRFPSTLAHGRYSYIAREARWLQKRLNYRGRKRVPSGLIRPRKMRAESDARRCRSVATDGGRARRGEREGGEKGGRGRVREEVAEESLGLRASRSRGRWPARVALTLTRPADLSFSRPPSHPPPPSSFAYPYPTVVALLYSLPAPHSFAWLPRLSCSHSRPRRLFRTVHDSAIFAGATRHGYIRSAYVWRDNLRYWGRSTLPPPRGPRYATAVGWKARCFFPRAAYPLFPPFLLHNPRTGWFSREVLPVVPLHRSTTYLWAELR